MHYMWTPDPDTLGEEWSTYTEDVRERSLALATSALMGLTNNRVGTAPEKYRPCPREERPCTVHDWEPYLLEPRGWLNPCGCRTARWCNSVSEIDLPGPVGYIDEIRVNGEEIALDDNWRLDNGHLLVWQGEGLSPVPETQDLSKPDTEAGTYSITYSRSYNIGYEGMVAVALLALEFAKAINKKSKCKLPKGVQTVARNGVSFTIEETSFPGGLTGIEQADVFVLKWNPPGSPARSAQVFSPRDLARGKGRRTSSLPLRMNA